ncbi:hypothetical protein MUS_4371 [Bacillus velezensis YAU B9601-Y2]|uniref:Uncharacterized protein n=1 Tax=Bacillus amyloliquefaciens (strain Y2) TaxID=1155777 RepID=I2CC30_BACAY|nr:hypothetical protein MUS_4371 [Bacillus velezensis YAU B9601-Y2]
MERIIVYLDNYFIPRREKYKHKKTPYPFKGVFFFLGKQLVDKRDFFSR